MIFLCYKCIFSNTWVNTTITFDQPPIAASILMNPQVTCLLRYFSLVQQIIVYVFFVTIELPMKLEQYFFLATITAQTGLKLYKHILVKGLATDKICEVLHFDDLFRN